MRKRIIFRADAGVNIGYGHFVRTLALANMLNKIFDCCFATVNPTEYQLSEIGKTCEYIHLPDGTAHFQYFLDLLSGDEIVVLDNYFFSTDYQIQIRNKGCVLVCIDDLHDKHYVADVVINHCLTDRSLFSVEPYTQLCLGFEWALLRKPFLRGNNRYRYSEVSKVIICFGGVDLYGFTEKVIHVLNELPSIEEIIAIVGDGYSYPDSSFSKVCYKRNLDAEEIATLFSTCDYAFLSASTITIEALSCHTPIAVGYYVDNQRDFYKMLNRSGIIYPLGLLFETDWIDEIPFALRQNKKTNVSFPQNIVSNYQRLFYKLAGYCDYKDEGLIFTDYRDLSVIQSEAVWEIRNCDEIRQWMDNPNPFSLEAHFSFIERLNTSSDKLYWAVFQNNDIVGSINIEFDENMQEVERGIFISPDYMGRSLGSLIEKTSENLFKQMGIKTVRAKVIKENVKSISFHLKNFYAKAGEDDRFIYYIKELNE